MEPSIYVAEARDSFQRFVSNHTDPDVDDCAVYLETLLAEWLYLGMGIEATAATYDHFLQVALAVVDGVMQGTLCLDYNGPAASPYRRRILGLVQPERDNSILTRFGYDQLVWQTQDGRRAEALGQLVTEALGHTPENRGR
jgi:hypothetical protein